MVDSPSTVEEDIAAAARVVRSQRGGVGWIYELLDDVAARHTMSSAWLVLRPERAGTQVFGSGSEAVTSEMVAALAARPAGVYGVPGRLDGATSAAIAALCDAEFRAAASGLDAAVDVSGLSSPAVIDGALARAAACAARYGWSSTAVLLTTSGGSPARERWLGLAAALRQAVRSGDEAGVAGPGVAGPGVALAILGNAGPDAVRPFIARVRAALSAGGFEGLDLHAATASTPQETVDPLELRHLAAERLAEIAPPARDGHERGAALELELRLLPGVVCVAMGTPIVVVSTGPSDAVQAQVDRLLRWRTGAASVRVVSAAGSGEARWPSGAPDAPAAVGVVQPGNGNGNGNGYGYGRLPAAERSERMPPRLLSVTAPGESTGGRSAVPRSAVPVSAVPVSAVAGDAARDGGEPRVSLVTSTFDGSSGVSEVSLALGAARSTGRAPAGPLVGGAQATLAALDALGMDVPFYLVSAERAVGLAGEPVVVVLAPRQQETARGEGGRIGAGERIGVASAATDVEGASRATLGALNRHLSRHGAP